MRLARWIRDRLTSRRLAPLPGEPVNEVVAQFDYAVAARTLAANDRMRRGQDRAEGKPVRPMGMRTQG